MKKKLNLGLLAVACVALLASRAMGGSVFFSTVGEVGGGVVPGNPEPFIDMHTGLTLYIWSIDDQDYDTTIGMNIVSSNPAAVALVAADVANPEIFSEALGAPVDTRWQDASVGDVTAGQVSNMNAAHVTSGTGVLAANDGTVMPFKNHDTLYDVDAGAFLLGSVTMEVVSPQDVFWTILSINQEGTALFVNAGEQVFPDFGFAFVGYIPEPSTLVLAAFGLIVMIGYGLNR